jgi:hypothetical protein
MTAAFVPKQTQQPAIDPFDWSPPSLANAVINPVTGKALEYRQLIKREQYTTTWTRSFANELGRLAHGIRAIEGTNTIFFIPK